MSFINVNKMNHVSVLKQQDFRSGGRRIGLFKTYIEIYMGFRLEGRLKRIGRWRRVGWDPLAVDLRRLTTLSWVGGNRIGVNR